MATAKIAAKVPSTPVLVKLGDIEVIHADNSRFLKDKKRKSYGDAEERRGTSSNLHTLAQSIKTNGQFQGVGIMHNPKGSKKPYRLVFGYRRMEAMSSILEWKADRGIMASDFGEYDPVKAAIVNYGENNDREDLTLAERIHAVWNLHTTHKMDAEKIAQAVGLSKPYINSLLRFRKNVAPRVWEHFAFSGEGPDWTFMMTEIIKEGISHEEQERAYFDKVTGQEAERETPEGNGDGNGGNGGAGGGEASPGKPRKPGEKRINEAAQQAREARKANPDDAYWDGVLAALRFVQGLDKTLTRPERT